MKPVDQLFSSRPFFSRLKRALILAGSPRRKWRWIAVAVAVVVAAAGGTAIFQRTRGAEVEVEPPQPALPATALAPMPQPAPAPAPEPTPAPAPPPATAPPPPPVEPKRRAPTGRLSLDTVPWTRVYRGGRVLGDTPLIEVPLPAGRQELRLVNEEKGISTKIEVTIEPGKSTAKRLKL